MRLNGDGSADVVDYGPGDMGVVWYFKDTPPDAADTIVNCEITRVVTPSV